MSEAIRIRAGGLRALGNAYLCRRYAVLFYTLLLTLVAVPLVAAFELSGALIEFFLAASLLAGVMPASTAKGRRILLTIMIAVWLARPATAWFDHRALSAMTLGLWTLIAMFAAAAALRFAMRARSVDLEHLYAALSAYLLAGIFFGIFYWAVSYTHLTLPTIYSV